MLTPCYSARVLQSAVCCTARGRTPPHTVIMQNSPRWLPREWTIRGSSVRANILSSCTSCLVRRCQQDRSGRRVTKDRSINSNEHWRGLCRRIARLWQADKVSGGVVPATVYVTAKSQNLTQESDDEKHEKALIWLLLSSYTLRRFQCIFWNSHLLSLSFRFWHGDGILPPPCQYCPYLKD